MKTFYLFERDLGRISARKASSDVDESQLVTELQADVVGGSCVLDGVGVCMGVAAAAAHVETRKRERIL